jgi:bifunctional non-homologous end joining protein LigD
MEWKPMLASPSNHALITSLGPNWVFDTKLDGVRALLRYDGDTVTLTNRNGVDITGRYPDVAAYRPPAPMVLDGEIIARSGSFQDLSRRDRNSLPAPALIASVPVTFTAFDLLELNGRDVRPTPYWERRTCLELCPFSPDPLFTLSMVSETPDLFDQVRARGGEGVVAKSKTAAYRAGRSPAWVKYKATSTITCVITGYEAGKGWRALGALFVAVIGPNGLVPIGRVGTGFTGPESERLRLLIEQQALDAAEGKPFVPTLVDVECLNVSRDLQLRHPSYKGVRTDLSVTDANLSQLDTIPRM